MKTMQLTIARRPTSPGCLKTLLVPLGEHLRCFACQCKNALLLSTAITILAPAHSATRHVATSSLPAIKAMLKRLPQPLAGIAPFVHTWKTPVRVSGAAAFTAVAEKEAEQ
jgi:hypothetical protein